MDKFEWGNFSAVSYFWLIILVFFLFFVGFRKRNRVLSQILSASMRDSMIRGQDTRKWKALSLFLVLFFSVIALMEPKYDYSWETVERKGTDLVIALDLSKSMYATDISPSRLERSKIEIKNLINILEGDRIGLVLFTSKGLIQCPLTLDYATFKLFLNESEIGTLPVGGTSLTEAIKESVKAFDKRYKKDRVLILVTDGETHDTDLEDGISEAKKAGVKIFAIGLGTEAGVPIVLPSENSEKRYVKDEKGNIVLTRLNDEPLKKMALETGGAYIEGNSSDFNLEKIYKKYIAPIEGREMEAKRKKRYEHRFYIPLAIAVLLLIMESFLPERK